MFQSKQKFLIEKFSNFFNFEFQILLNNYFFVFLVPVVIKILSLKSMPKNRNTFILSKAGKKYIK